MLDHPITAFDIETIPDPDYGRRALALDGDNAAVIEAMTRQRLEDTEGRTQYPQPPLHRIVTVAVAHLDPGSGDFDLATLGESNDAWDERSHLHGFADLIEQTSPRLVSWNGSGFDLPIIRYRAMLHGVAMPALYRADGEWKWNNYHNRFHDRHVDLMDVLSGYGASTRAGLGLMCELLGLPDKAFIDGEVYEHILRGEEDRVREYCKLDVVLTLLVFLSWLRQRGDLDDRRVRDLVAGIRAKLRGEGYEGWQEIADGLEGWPRLPARPEPAASDTPSAEAPATTAGATPPPTDREPPNPDTVRRLVAAGRDCAMEMLENANFIERELSNVELSEPLVEETKQLCARLVGTKHDIMTELAELDELLETRASAKDLRTRTQRIAAWLGEDVDKLKALVAKLEATKKEDATYTVAWVLVAESAGNILDAFSGVAAAAGEID